MLEGPGTEDEDRSWITIGRLDGAASISFTGPGDGVALASRRGCRAAVMETADGGTTWDTLRCLSGGEPLAVATAGAEIAAQVGNRLHVSTDSGETWSRVD